MEKQIMDKKSLLEKIQQLQFMTVELNLYLDTHPNCQRGLMEYNHYTQQLKMLKNKYEQMYGPLTNFGYSTNQGEKWKWIYEPWPWQTDYKTMNYMSEENEYVGL